MNDQNPEIGPMSKAEMEAFLAGGEICRVGCLDPDGYPHLVPVWFHYQDGGFYLVGREKSLWATCMSRDPKATLCVDTLPVVRKVLVRGDAEVLEPPNVGGRWVEIASDMAYRYLGKDGPKYLEPTMNEPRWLIFLRPHEIKTWQGNYTKLQ